MTEQMTSTPPGGSILGTRVKRVEDRALTTHGGTYTANVTDPRLRGALFAVFVRSVMAHADIAGIDTTEAAGCDGVAGVFTAADLGLGEPAERYDTGVAEPYLATDRVRYVGQAVAVVVADTEAHAVDAADLVMIDYRPLPAVVGTAAAGSDDTLLFPARGTNTVKTLGDAADPALFEGCDVVVSQSVANNRVAPTPLEGRAALAVWDGGRLTMWLPNQGAQLAQSDLAAAFEIDKSEVHVITPDVGGAFGAKFGAEPDHVVVAAAARLLGRAVRWVETRSENMTVMNHGRAQQQTVTIGGTRDGRMQAYHLDVVQDCGAYPRLGVQCVGGTLLMAPGVYAFDRVAATGRCVMTTTTPVGAFRGAGRPEATAAVERAVDIFAAAIEMDPAEVRRRNLLPHFASPRESVTGARYDSGDYPAALQTVLAAADYDALRREQRQRRADGADLQLGIGLSSYVEITGGGKENATVTVHPDGSASVFTGVSPHGQGHATAWAMIVSDQLGIDVDKIELVWGDTDLVPRGGGTGGSRSLQMGGVAAHQAAVKVAELAKERAAELLEVDAADLVIDRGRASVGVAGVPGQFLSFSELAAREELSAQTLFTADGSTYPFGAHLALVEVDVATGLVRLRRLWAVDDAGTVVNPMLFDGQRHGGLAQGVSQALYEEARFDKDGNPTAATFADYGMPTAADLPSFDLVDMQTPTPYNPLGVKGIGEAATIGATPAVQNAVVDAVSHLGVRHIDMPLTPPRVWQAIRDAEDTVGHQG